MSAGYFGKRSKLYLDDLFWGLVASSHILHHHGVLDAYGHVSVRNPDDPSSFFMPMNMAPALLSSAADIVEYKVADASPAEPDETRRGYIERFIHSELYKKFPAVNAVVHSHAADVLPYTVAGVPLRATVHMSGFLGAGAPVWDIASAYSGSQKHSMLVDDGKLGHSLAAAFRPASSAAFLYGKVKAALPAQLTGASSAADDSAAAPEHLVVLMRGHGFTTCADSLEAAVFQSIYTKEAARVQTAALNLKAAYFAETLEGKVDVEGGGKIKSAKVRQEGEIKHLSEREAADAWEANSQAIARPWGLWCREVEVNPLYRNECKRNEEEK